ncbi:MAG: SgcJ/EcaC family oxidoreductase [Balneolaceae bacterium]|nr:SgcJ/EcaC family oxidoreductase [Balneolaceae bacterium]
MYQSHKVFAIFTILLVIITGCERGTELPVNDEEDIRFIEQMSADRAEAFRNGDAAGIAVHFTEDGILMAPGSPTQQGREAVQEYYQSIFNEFETSLESYYDEVEVSGNIAFGRGFADVTAISRETGDTLRSTSKYINILQRQPDGTWQTTHDIWNDNE